MELATKIIIRYFNEHELEIVRNEVSSEFDRIVESQCYNAMKEIREILNNDALDDPECFWRIEKIVRVFEEMGADGGNRHDF